MVDTAPSRDDFVAAEPEANLPELNADGTPKRRRGRPPGSKNRPKDGSAPRSGRSLENQIGGMLILVNAPLQLIPLLQRDALDPVEIKALAKAVDQECQRSPKFRKYVESALKVQGASSLLAVVSLIGARRVVRHIEVPETVGDAAAIDQTLGTILATVSNTSIVSPDIRVPPPVEVPVE